MPSLIDLRRRVRATKSTQQITKAMKMVSSSKLRRAQERILRGRPYALEMLRVFNNQHCLMGDPAVGLERLTVNNLIPLFEGRGMRLVRREIR